MREIIFRGKRADNGEWVEGNLFISDTDNAAHILLGSRRVTLDYQVIPETVGQYTGLKDKNGKKIFEGDIVKQTFEKTDVIVASGLWEWEDERGDLYGEDVGAVVIIPSKGACIKNPVIHREVNGDITEHGEKRKMYKPISSCRCEVISNVHDNPELLKGECNE